MNRFQDNFASARIVYRSANNHIALITISDFVYYDIVIARTSDQTDYLIQWIPSLI